MNFSAAIFDLDGTIIDSNTVWAKIDKIILNKRGIPCSDDLAEKLSSMTYENAAEEMHRLGVIESTEELIKEFNDLAVQEYRENIILKDHVHKYFDFLKSKGIKIALATASPEILYRPVLMHNQVYEYFDAFCTTDEAGKSKDFPDVYLLATSKINVKPCECVVFEDVLNGIISAKKAGMTAIGVYDRYSAGDMERIKEEADRFIIDFSEMM